MFRPACDAILVQFAKKIKIASVAFKSRLARSFLCWTELVVEAGADLLVAGSAVFDSGHPEKEARILLNLAREAEERRQGQNFHPARAGAI